MSKYLYVIELRVLTGEGCVRCGINDQTRAWSKWEILDTEPYTSKRDADNEAKYHQGDNDEEEYRVVRYVRDATNE